jgi:hypothetical protein
MAAIHVDAQRATVVFLAALDHERSKTLVWLRSVARAGLLGGLASHASRVYPPRVSPAVFQQ